MALRQHPMLARLFPLLSLLGICAVGILLYLLHNAVLTVQRVDFEYTKAFSLIDELRTDSRRLTGLVHRATASDANLDIGEEFQRIIDIREGNIARPPTVLVAPGIAVSFLSLVESLPLTTMEQELLLKAYDTSQALAAQEQQAISMVAHIDIDDMVSAAARSAVRQAIHLVTSKEYTNNTEEIQRNLEGVLQSITDRMREDNNQSHQAINLLILGICLVLFITLGSLVVMAHAPQIPTTTRGKHLQPRHIYLYIVLLLTLAFAVPIAFIYTDARSILVTALEKRQALICNEVYSELNLRATQALELAKIAGIRPPVRNYIASYNADPMQAVGAVQALEVLQTFTNNYTDIATSLLLDKTGKVLLSTTARYSPTTSSTILLPPKILERAMAGESFIAAIPTPNSTIEELVAITPVFGPPPLQAIVNGAVVSILDRHNSFRLWEGRLAAEEHMNIFILNQDGKIILSSRGIERTGAKLLYEGAAKIVQTGATGLQYYTDGQGVSRIGFFREIPELGWTVAATSSYVTLTASVREILLRAGIFGLFTILVTIVLFSLLMQRMTASLRAANQRMDDIVDSAGMFTYDLDVTTGNFVHNARWCHFWQYPGPALKGTKHISFVLEKLYPESVPVLLNILSDKREGETFTIDFQLRTCEGETRWCRQMGRVESCDAQGQPTRIMGTGFDITAQKVAEETVLWHSRQLEETVILRTAELEESRNQAEAASQAKTAFLSTVSHEIRTPMNAIVGFAHIFDRSNLTTKQKEQLEKIKLSAAALLGVINDVLDISKIEAGKLEIERTAFYLHNMLDTVCSIVDFATSEKDLVLTVTVAPDVPEVLMGDPKRISQILLNLMNNAVKFTATGSITLNVGLDDSTPDGNAPDNDASNDSPMFATIEGASVMLAFSVADTGIGLSPDQITRLFKPFMQADSSVTRRFGGTGLGLAISKQLVELMGGSIGVISELGRGSTFHFTLRLTVPATGTETLAHTIQASTAITSPEYASRLRALAGVHVLVVEDNDINQEIAAALLQELGIEPDMADNGVLALSMAAQKHYHCILMDMQMPIMGGLEAAQRLRAMGAEAASDPNATEILRWLARIPIIAMTANAMAEDRQRCLDAGMDDHISKPIDPEALQRCMLRWLEATVTKPSP